MNSKLAQLLFFLLLLVFGSMVFLFLKGQKEESKRQAKPQSIPQILVKEVYPENLIPVLEISGRISGMDRVSLTPEVSGKILANSFKLRTGNRFRQGQALAYLDGGIATNQWKIQMSTLMATTAEMLAEMKLDLPEQLPKWQAFFAELTLTHLPELPETESEKEKLYLTRFQLYTQYYSARNQQKMVAKYTLRAPFSGTVAQASVSPGNLASPGMVLATLVRTDIYEIEIALSQEEAAQLARPGQEVAVIAENVQDTLKGVLKRLSNVVDRSTQTVSAVVQVRPGKHAVRDGSYAKVIMHADELPSAVEIPRSALYKGKYALVIKNVREEEHAVAQSSKKGASKKKAEKAKSKASAPAKIKKQVGDLKIVPIQVAWKDGSTAYIIDGLKKGELVVIQAVQGVEENMPVTPRMQER
jgi:RND family efflux transporter MFP subunit